MEQHHITAMAAQAKEVHAGMLGLTADESMAKLIKIIHGPGFTTPAEAAFLSGILEAMQAHTKALAALQKTALDGASRVMLIHSRTLRASTTPRKTSIHSRTLRASTTPPRTSIHSRNLRAGTNPPRT